MPFFRGERQVSGGVPPDTTPYTNVTTCVYYYRTILEDTRLVQDDAFQNQIV